MPKPTFKNNNRLIVCNAMETCAASLERLKDNVIVFIYFISFSLCYYHILFSTVSIVPVFPLYKPQA